ncbi:DUF4344 domain-containing metallopeptidase [Pseudomonadota bacterium AL_CKDN230030165-1A_HGKHYDSX7]
MHLRGVALLLALGVCAFPAHAEFEQQLGPLAGAVRQQMTQGWTASVQDGWFTLYNANKAGSEQTLYLQAGPAPSGGRIVDVNVVVRSNSPKAAIGLAFTNRANKAICLLEITADKTTHLFCVNGQSRKNIATVPNLAKLDGSDRIRLIEADGAARFILNGQKVGDIADEPAMGSELGIMAYDVGTFGIADFGIVNNVLDKPAPGGQPQGQPSRGGGAQQAPQQQPAAAPPRPRSPDSDNVLPGEGPYPRFGGDSVRVVSVYLGLMRSIFMHEFGHALIGELELPATGAEEDAVDIYSALRIVEPSMYPSGDRDLDEIARGSATYAALQWYYSGKIGEAKGSTSPWQDEHTGDLKRFRNMFCIMYGGNPEAFESLARSVKFEDRTKARCIDEFNKQNRAWRRILAPHTRIGTWEPDGQQPANAPGAPVNVTFEPSSRKIGNFYGGSLAKALTDNIQNLGKTYVLPRPINVTFKDCGKLNAWYSPREGSITMCYELIEHLAVMISDIEMGTVNGEVVDRSGGAAPARQQTSAPAPQRQGANAPANAPANAFNELEDRGVPPSALLFTSPYKGPTPNKHYNAKVVRTADLADLVQNERKFIMVDTSGLLETIPQSYSLIDAGSDGSVRDSLQSALDAWLNKQSGGDRNAAIVFFGAGMNDRSSYNAALRAATLGWRTYWYRGGIEAWKANGLRTVSVKPMDQKPQQ